MKRLLARAIARKGADDERGAILILTAAAAVLLIAASALAVDYGSNVAMGESVQSVANAAALETAQYLNTTGASLTAEANAALAQNQFSTAAPNTVSVTSGCWNGTTFTAEGSGSCTSASSVNVTVSQPGPDLFFGGKTTLVRSAVASAIPAAGFDIGTTLATVNSSQSTVLASLFAALTNSPTSPVSSATIGLVGYQGLASTGVTLSQLITASGGVLTTSNLMSYSMSGSQLVTWLGTALATQSAAITHSGGTVPTALTNAITALNAWTSATPALSTTSSVTLCQILTVNGSGCTVPTSALATNVNVLQALQSAADFDSPSGGINLNTAFTGLGIASAKLSLSVVHPPQYAFGSIGSVAKTNQASESLVITLNAGLAAVTITLPLTVAAGQATLSSMNCDNNNASSVSLAVATNALSETTGVNEPVISVSALSIGLVSLPLPLTIGATGSGNPVFTPPYSQTDEQNVPNPPTAPTVTLSAPSYGLLGLLSGTVSAVVNPILNLLDGASGGTPLLDTIVQATGLSIDQATVATTYANCSYPVLAG